LCNLLEYFKELVAERAARALFFDRSIKPVRICTIFLIDFCFASTDFSVS